MKSFAKVFYYSFWGILLITLYTFIRHVDDAGDFDLLGIGRDRFFNNLIPYILFPISVILFSTWIFRLKQFSQDLSPTNKFLLRKKFIPNPLWWIPILHFTGSVNTLNFISEKMKDSNLDKSHLKKVRSGGVWIKASFGIFYTLVIFAFAYYYFAEKNKDGYDFFLTTLFLFLITLSIGMIKMSTSISNIEENN